jgi:hypothetical protein
MSADGADAPETLDCPFCLEPIRPNALVCRHCGRDVAIPMPLLLAQRAQAGLIEALQRDLAALRAELASRPTTGAAPDPAPAPAGPLPPVGAPSRPPLAPLGLGLAVSFVLVLAAHWFLVIRADVATVVLRAVCIALPFAVAVCVPALGRTALRPLLGGTILLGLGAVLAMSAVVGHQDGTPVLPRTGRDLFEMAEFAASIGLSFLAGALILQALERFRARQRAALAAGAKRPAGKDRLSELGLQLGPISIGETLTAAVAAIGAVIAAFRGIWE